MEAQNATPVSYPLNLKEKRPYGKAPFELDLPQALEAVERISQEGKTLPESKLAVVLGNTITSSAFTRKIRSLVAYGLLAEQAGQFALTDLALTIVLPRSPQAQIEAKKQAFLRIEQFSFLFNQHKGKLLPADEFLRNILEQESGIPRDVSQEWVRHFKEGARVAGLFHSRGDGKIQIAESPIFTYESTVAPLPQSSENLDEPPRVDGDGSRAFVEHRPADGAAAAPQPWSIAASGHCTRIELSNGRRAEINIPDKLSPKDAQKIQRALDGVKVIIEGMIMED